MRDREAREDGSGSIGDAYDEATGPDLRMRAMQRRAIQRKASQKETAGRAEIPDGGGTPLSPSVRAHMEPQLGAELGDVRVHTDGGAAQAAQHLGARAFTVGSDVHFNAGEFAPGTREGDRLLAHELTHVVQGKHSGVRRKAEPGREEDLDVSQPHEPAEEEADVVADRVVGTIHDGTKGGGAAPRSSLGAHVGRKVFLSPQSTTQQNTSTQPDSSQQTTEPNAPGNASGGQAAPGAAGQVPVGEGGPEGEVDPQFEQIDKSKVKTIKGTDDFDGTSEKSLIEYEGKWYLFKPSKGDAPVMRAQDKDIQQGQYARRAAAGAEVAGALGLDTPGVRLVEIGGVRGSLQEFQQGRTLKEIHLDEPALYQQIEASPEFQKLRSDIMALDFLINNLDRNEGNFFVDLGTPGTADVVKLRPIDHDLCFTKDPDRPPVIPGWIDGFPEKYTRTMWDNLKKLKANTAQFTQVLEKFLMQQEIAGVFKRLDDLLADIDQKIAAKGEAGTFHQ